MNHLRIFLAGMTFFLLVACNNNVDPAGDAPPVVSNAGLSCADVEIAENDESDESDSDLLDLGGCTLRVAVENEYEPFSFIDTTPDILSGTLSTDTTPNGAMGYDYDIFDEICYLLNCEPEFVEVSWDEMVDVMERGEFSEFDVGANGITITAERAESVDFSAPYISLKQVMLVRVDEARFIDATEFITDTTLLLGSQPGTINYDHSVDLVGEERVRAYDELGRMVQAVVLGHVDGVVVDELSGDGYEWENRDKVKVLEISEEILERDELGFIFPKESALTAAVNSALDELESNRELEKLINLWFTTE